VPDAASRVNESENYWTRNFIIFSSLLFFPLPFGLNISPALLRIPSVYICHSASTTTFQTQKKLFFDVKYTSSFFVIV